MKEAFYVTTSVKNRGMTTPLLVYAEKLLYSIGKSCSFTFDPIREGAMTAKRILQSIVVVVILAASFVSTGGVLAWSGCAGYITVQSGDTLSGIAAACDTTVEAIQAANPGLGWWLYAGQVLYIPTGYNTSAPAYNPSQTGVSTYVIQWGDTLGNIAIKNGVSLSDILAVNPQIWNASLIFPGQVINLPAPVSVPPSTNYPSTYNPYTCTPSTNYPSACNPFTNYPSTYNPYNCTPSTYNSSACTPSTYYPSTDYSSPADSTQFSDLKITSVPGLLVRAGAGMNYSEIKSPFVSAVKDTYWRYRKDSVTVDSTGLVWVEVALSQMVNGYSTGWIMVRDQLGSHFTEPKIDP